MSINFTTRRNPESHHSNLDVIVDVRYDEPMIDIDVGTAELGGEYMLPDEILAVNDDGETTCAGVSNALTGLRYKSPSGKVIDAELFTDDTHANIGSLENFDIYPLDGKDKPFNVSTSPELFNELLDNDKLFAKLCAAMMYRYVENERKA